MSGKPEGGYDKEDFTAAILAGGRGRRLGTNKALLEIEGKTILDRILEKMLEVFPHVLLVVKDEDK